MRDRDPLEIPSIHRRDPRVTFFLPVIPDARYKQIRNEIYKQIYREIAADLGSVSDYKGDGRGWLHGVRHDPGTLS